MPQLQKMSRLWRLTKKESREIDNCTMQSKDTRKMTQSVDTPVAPQAMLSWCASIKGDGPLSEMGQPPREFLVPDHLDSESKQFGSPNYIVNGCPMQTVTPLCRISV